MFVVCAVRETARSVHANGITYIWFCRRRSRTNPIRGGNNLVSKEITRNGLVAWNVFDV